MLYRIWHCDCFCVIGFCWLTMTTLQKYNNYSAEEKGCLYRITIAGWISHSWGIPLDGTITNLLQRRSWRRCLFSGKQLKLPKMSWWIGECGNVDGNLSILSNGITRFLTKNTNWFAVCQIKSQESIVDIETRNEVAWCKFSCILMHTFVISTSLFTHYACWLSSGWC